MIQADAVQAVAQGEHALNFVRLNHRQQEIANRELCASLPATIVRHRPDCRQIVGGMPPFRRQPSVIEIQPAYQSAVVKGGLDRIQLMGGAQDARPVRHLGAGDDGAPNAGVQASKWSAIRPQPMLSIRQRRAVVSASSLGV